MPTFTVGCVFIYTCFLINSSVIVVNEFHFTSTARQFLVKRTDKFRCEAIEILFAGQHPHAAILSSSRTHHILTRLLSITRRPACLTREIDEVPNILLKPAQGIASPAIQSNVHVRNESTIHGMSPDIDELPAQSVVHPQFIETAIAGVQTIAIASLKFGTQGQLVLQRSLEMQVIGRRCATTAPMPSKVWLAGWNQDSELPLRLIP